MSALMLAAFELLRDDSGQDLLEYSLLAVLIALVAMVAVRSVGTTMTDLWWGPIADQL
jgi:Flp pilus assembly pilin Flp